ncbi:MAG: RNA polymerase sigma factor RpoD, partial [Betaproteobacteria bacterium]
MAKKTSKPRKNSRSASKHGRKVKTKRALRKPASRGGKSTTRRSTKLSKPRKAAKPRKATHARKAPLKKKKSSPKAKLRTSRKAPQKPKTTVKSRGGAIGRKPTLVSKTPALPTAKTVKTNGKGPAKAAVPPGKPGAPLSKPSPGEIAARLSAKRTEKALAEGKVRSGKNGSVELRKLELSPAEAEARKTRLKNLIVLGKERSYLTYAEINDHLPDDILDAEQIEGIISMINDMGIQVYDEAPDAETLLMSEAAPTAAADDVDEEAAEAAASTLDSEFGRTTDPVRMYMREMGSVELLTREGEIEIAKRIEEGLKYMIMAISACPMTVAQILELASKIERDELKVDDVVDGLMDFTEQLEAIDDDDIDESEESEDDSGAIAAENLERLKVAALERFAVIRRLYTRMLGVLQKDGHKTPKYLELQKKISAELMQIRFGARQVERLCDSVRCEVDNIRQIERKIQDLVVNKGGMPRPDFIKRFPEHETSLRWIDREIAAKQSYSEPLTRYRQAIVEQQHKLLDLQKRVMIPLKD